MVCKLYQHSPFCCLAPAIYLYSAALPGVSGAVGQPCAAEPVTSTAGITAVAVTGAGL